MKRFAALVLAACMALALAGCAKLMEDSTLREGAELLLDELEKAQQDLAGETEAYSVDLVSFRYPASATLTEEAGDTVISRGAGNMVILRYMESEVFYSTAQLVFEVAGYGEADATYPLPMGGVDWGHVRLEVDGMDMDMYVYSTGYESYVLYCLVDEANTLAETVLETLLVDTTEQDAAMDEATRLLAGEWDLGTMGYMIIGADGSFNWYMTADLDPDYLLEGTFRADNKIPTRAAGYAEGIYMEVHYTANTYEGERVETDYELAYAFEPVAGEEGAYTVYNLNDGGVYPGVVKVG